MRRRESGRVEEVEEDAEAEVGGQEAAVGCDGLPGSLPQRGAGLPFTPEKGPDERAAAPARRHWRSHSRCGATLRVTKRAVTEGGTPRPLPTPPRPSVSHTRLPVPGHKRPVHHPALGAAPPPPPLPPRHLSAGAQTAAVPRLWQRGRPFFFFFFFWQPRQRQRRGRRRRGARRRPGAAAAGRPVRQGAGRRRRGRRAAAIRAGTTRTAAGGRVCACGRRVAAP